MKRLIDSLVVHQIRLRLPTYVPRRSAARLSILTAFALVGQTIGQEAPKPTQPTPPRSMREMVMMPVVYRIAAMDKVTVESNLKYTEVNNPHLLMDVYHPPNLAKNEHRPAVLFIHGGAGFACDDHRLRKQVRVCSYTSSLKLRLA